MDDMTPFERHLADGFKGLMGPSEPVDDAAIFAAISTTRSHKWRFRAMFSATRFVVAAAIVALFGGFAITGIVSVRQTDQSVPGVASPSPMTTESLLAGMDTQEVEPGVFRVDSDGIRPLSRPIGTGYKGVTIAFEIIQDGMGGTITAGLDGSVWWFDQAGFFRLGEPAVHAWPNERQVTDFVRYNQSDRVFDLEVGPDGTVWLARNGSSPFDGEISSFDGASWSVHQQLDGDIVGVEVLRSGDVWGAWAHRLDGYPYGKVTIARLGEAGWEPLPEVIGDGNADLSVAAASGGEVWLMPGVAQRLQRYDGDGWAVQTTPDAGFEMRADAGADGTLWVRLSRDCEPGEPGDGGCVPGGGGDGLARFAGRDWEVFEASDGIPVSGSKELAFTGFFEAAPDGSLWWDPRVDEFVDTLCDGVANFDGQALRRYLRGMCIYAMDVAPDGAVWLQGRLPKADDAQPIDTYVITPEVVAATEAAATEAAATE